MIALFPLSASGIKGRDTDIIVSSVISSIRSGLLVGASGGPARMIEENYESLDPSKLKAVTLNLIEFPRIPTKLVTQSSLSVGINLTAGSFAKFISATILPPAPSSLYTAYPRIGQPPSLVGGFQPILMDVEVEVIR